MLILWLLTTLILSSWIFRIQSRLTHLESKYEPARVKPKTVSVPKKITEEFKSDTPKSVPQEVSKKEFNFEQFLGQKLFPLVGAASIVIAIGFFAVWAFANGWVGPMGRIAIGIIVSLFFIGLGEYLKPKYPDFFTSLIAIGLAGLITTTLISHYAYDFISSFQTLTILGLQAVVGVLLSLRYNSRLLTNFSITAGLLAPWFTGELNPMLILPFVLILTVAGFAIAVQKKWPETLVGLIVLGSSYIFSAVEKLNRELINSQFDLNLHTIEETIVNPYLLLSFAAVIYALIGSAGVVRLLTNYKDKEPPTEESGEMVIFTLSLVLFNLCAAGIFASQGWQHIGFLVLAQATGLIALAQWFKNKNWNHFQQLTLSSSLLFIILATLWELRNIESLMLTIALTIEGALMCAIGQFSKQKVYEWFGRGTIFIAYLSSFKISSPDFWLEALLTFTFITAFLYSIGRGSTTLDKIWQGLSFFIISALILTLSLGNSVIPEILKPLLLTAWTLGLTYSAFVTLSRYLQVVASLLFFVLALVTLNAAFPQTWLYLINWLWILLAGIPLFLLKNKHQDSTSLKTFIGYLTVSIMALSWLYVTAKVLNEPLLTLSWLSLICALMFFGLRFKNFHELRYIGLGVLLFIIAKLYLVDVWSWDTPVRVVAFMSLGIILLIIGFFYQKIWVKK